MPWLPDIVATETATFTIKEGAGAGRRFAVQFNPASLEYTIANEFDDRNGENGARQFVKKASAKLTMTLVFDTTTTGASVRDVTANIAALLETAPDGSKAFAPKVEFGWGSYRFKGVVEQFKETIDFFSASGVPLRSSINLTLASQKVEFQSNRSPAPAADSSARPEPVSTAPGTAPSAVADQLGDPRAARSIASASGSASLRFGGSASLSVGAGVTLAAAASFAVGAEAGVSAGGGIGIGGGAGIGAGAGAGFDAGASAGAGLGVGIGTGASAGAEFGLIASAAAGVGVGGGSAGFGIAGGLGGAGLGGSAGFGASAGLDGAGFSATAITATSGPAFGGLRISPPIAMVSVGDARAALLAAPALIGAASFGPGGRARVLGGGSLSAEVGAGSALSGRIAFGD